MKVNPMAPMATNLEDVIGHLFEDVKCVKMIEFISVLIEKIPIG